MIKICSHLILAVFSLLIMTSSLWIAPAPVQAVVNGCCEYRLDPNATTNTYAPMTDTDCEKTVKIKFYPAYVPNSETPPTACIAQPDLGDSTPKISNPLDNPILSVGIPGLSLRPSTCTATECTTPWLGDYIGGLYKYGITAIALLAVIGLMIGGILWTSSAGNDERVGDAKKWIGGSLMGVLISLTAYTVLNIINPALTELSPIKVSTIEKEDLGPYEIDSEVPGNITDTAECPPGITGLNNLTTYFTTKAPTFIYSQSNRGDCANGKCYCDCSWFALHLGKCAGLKTAPGEGTSAGLLANPNKKPITKEVCNSTTILSPGDIIALRTTCKKDGKIVPCGHVLTYIGNNQVIECGGGSTAGLTDNNGVVKLSDFKKKCNEYLLSSKRTSYYIKR